jgi:hypothetical protein
MRSRPATRASARLRSGEDVYRMMADAIDLALNVR